MPVNPKCSVVTTDVTRSSGRRFNAFLFGCAGGMLATAVTSVLLPLYPAFSVLGATATGNFFTKVLQGGVVTGCTIFYYEEGLFQGKVRGWSNDKFDPMMYGGALFFGAIAGGTAVLFPGAGTVGYCMALNAVKCGIMLPSYTHIVEGMYGFVDSSRRHKMWPIHLIATGVSCSIAGAAVTALQCSAAGIPFATSMVLMNIMQMALYYICTFVTLDVLETTAEK